MNISEKIIDELSKNKVNHIFIIPGAQIDTFFYSIISNKNIKPVLVNHELSAGFMAEGYARINKTIGVASSIGGPGASYMLASAVNSKLENTPVLFITGSNDLKKNASNLFQDTYKKGSNDKGLFKAALSKSYILSNENDLNKILTKILKLLSKNKPCHLTLPLNIQEASINTKKLDLIQDNTLLENKNIKIKKSFSKKRDNEISLKHIFNTIKKNSPKNTSVFVDSGQTRYAANKYFKKTSKINFFESAKQSPMGWGICAAMGAQFATKTKKVISVFGDGSMRMFGIELSTAIKYNIPVIFILCDNGAYGTIYSRYKNSIYKDYLLLDYINWEEFVNSFGMQCFYVDEEKKFNKIYKKAFKLENSCLIWIKTPIEDKIVKENKFNTGHI